MTRRRFSYKQCIDMLNSVVSPDGTMLPSLDKKTGAMAMVSDYIQDNLPPVLYRYMPMSIYAMSSIINNDVYMVSAAKMNDVFEGAAFGIESSAEVNRYEIQRIQDELFLKSFSYAKDSNLMWSHYGDAHKGICIGYDFSKASREVRRHLYPVQYSDTRFSFMDAERIASHPFLLLRKSTDWKYEKEFRLIYRKDELCGKTNLQLDCISEITFGLRADPQQIEIVKRLIKNMPICLYQTKQEENSFKLTRREL